MGGRGRVVALLSTLALGAASLVSLAQPASAATYSTAQIDCGTTSASSPIAVSGILSAGDSVTISYVGCNGYTLTPDATAFPNASAINENGNNAEVRTFTGYASGSTLATLTKNSTTYTIVQGAGTAPAFTASSPGPATMNVAYSYTFAASGSPAPTFTIDSGSVPSGMTLASNGVLSGTTTTAGTSSFVVKATNSAGSATASVSLSVRPQVSKVTICHRTRATTNPYVLITVSVNAVINSSGHNEHDTTRTNKTNPQNGSTSGSGPFNPSFNYPSNKKWWGDIIPPFSYASQGASYPAGSFAGLNWSPNWAVPGAVDQGAAGYWITNAKFAEAIGANAPSDAYKAAVEQCINLSSPPVTTRDASAVAADLYKINRDSGENQTDARADLDELDPSNPPANIQNIVDTFSAAVVTNNPTNVTQTSGTLNGTLNATTGGATWSSSYFNYYTGTNSPTSTTPTSESGTSAISRSATVPGLTCGTTYYYQIVGTTVSPAGTYYGDWKSFTTDACGNNNNGNGNGSNGNGNGNGNNREATPTPTPTPSPSTSSLNRRPPALPTQRPSASPTPSQSNGSAPSPTSSPRPTPSTSPSPRAPEPPVTLDPTNVIPLDPGDEPVPGTTEVIDPKTGEPTKEVVDPSGTWKVNPNGTITFTPAPGFVGTATLNVQLSGRSGKLYIQPMSVRIAAKSRIAIVTGDVPRSISAGVVRTGIVRASAEGSAMTYGEFRKLTR